MKKSKNTENHYWRKIKNFFYKLYWSIRNFFCDPFIKHKNYKLCERYPFLRLPGDETSIPRSHRYKYTFLDEMPRAWKKSFGVQMCEEIRNELIRCSTPEVDWLKKYSICQVKEKYGTLCWYDNGTPIDSTIDNIISKYEDRSMMVCQVCGKPVKYCTKKGWVVYVCKKHFDQAYKHNKYVKYDYEKLEKEYRMYQEDIPYRQIYSSGSYTNIPSFYDAEMRELWPDKKPKEEEK